VKNNSKEKSSQNIYMDFHRTLLIKDIPMQSSLFKKVGIASLIMMGSIFLSRVMGLVREMVIAGTGGVSGSVDAYQIAFIIPEILNHILASGFLSVTFIPIFSAYLAENREDEGWHVFSTILTCFGCLMLVFIVLSEIFTSVLVDIVAMGRDKAFFRERAVVMTRIILPAQFFFFAGGLFMAVQFAKERFFIPALAPLIYNLGIILGGIGLYPHMGMKGFSWGVLGGALVGNFILQWWGAQKAGMRFRLSFTWRHPDLRKYIILTLPLIVGLTMTFSTEIFFRFFGAFLPEGGIAGLNYGLRLMYILVALFGQAVGVAAYPYMARLALEDKIDEMNDLLNETLRYLAMVIPFSVVLMVLREQVVMILFQHGRFDAIATEITASVYPFLLAGAFAFAAQTIVQRGFYARQNTLFPAIFASIAVLLSLPLYWFGMQRLGIVGVALAISLSAILQIVILFVLWNRQSGNVASVRVYSFYGIVIMASIPMGVILEGFKGYLLHYMDASTRFGALAICGIIGFLFTVLFVLTGYLFKIREITYLVEKIAAKIRSTPS
jgi:putative peptidoglycan lipid II flippase